MIFLFLLQCLWTKLCYLYHSILLHLMGVISLFFLVIRLKDFFSVFFFHVFWPFSYIKFTICFWRLPCVKQEAQQHKILYLGLYLLIWGEAANLRFMPECLCYIFHHVSWKFCWNWLRFMPELELYILHVGVWVIVAFVMFLVLLWRLDYPSQKTWRKNLF